MGRKKRRSAKSTPRERVIIPETTVTPPPPKESISVFCLKCLSRVPLIIYVSHMIGHVNRREMVVCTDCGKILRDEKDMLTHFKCFMAEARRSPTNSVACPNCDYRAPNKYRLPIHRMCFHPEEVSNEKLAVATVPSIVQPPMARPIRMATVRQSWTPPVLPPTPRFLSGPIRRSAGLLPTPPAIQENFDAGLAPSPTFTDLENFKMDLDAAGSGSDTTETRTGSSNGSVVEYEISEINHGSVAPVSAKSGQVVEKAAVVADQSISQTVEAASHLVNRAATLTSQSITNDQVPNSVDKSSVNGNGIKRSVIAGSNEEASESKRTKLLSGPIIDSCNPQIDSIALIDSIVSGIDCSSPAVTETRLVIDEGICVDASVQADIARIIDRQSVEIQTDAENEEGACHHCDKSKKKRVYVLDLMEKLATGVGLMQKTLSDITIYLKKD